MAVIVLRYGLRPKMNWASASADVGSLRSNLPRDGSGAESGDAHAMCARG